MLQSAAFSYTAPTSAPRGDIEPQLTEHVNSLSMSFCPVPARSASAIAMLSATRRPPRNLARPRLYLQQPHQVSTYSSSATKAIFNILLFTYSLAIRTLPSGDLQHDVSLYGLAPVTRLRASMSRNVLCRLGKAQDSRALLADSCSADFANASLVCKLYQTLFCVPW
jgi:hypothetical protein